MRQPKLQTRIRRDQIAEAALALVAEQGFRRLSVAQVARRVGLAPSALYRHYPGKEAVLDAVVLRVEERLHGIVAVAERGEGDAIEALRRLLGLHLRLIRDNQASFAVLLNDAFHSGGLDRRRRVFAVIDGYIERVARLLRRGQLEGAVRGDVKPRTLALFFMGLVQPSAMLWVLSGGTFDIRRPGREAWPLLEQLLRGTNATRRARGAAGS